MLNVKPRPAAPIGDWPDPADLIYELLAPPAWHADAACRGVDPDIFYPTRGEDTNHARRYCDTCPVRADCAAAGRHEQFGIWGGESTKQRKARRRKETAA